MRINGKLHPAASLEATWRFGAVGGSQVQTRWLNSASNAHSRADWVHRPSPRFKPPCAFAESLGGHQGSGFVCCCYFGWMALEGIQRENGPLWGVPFQISKVALKLTNNVRCFSTSKTVGVI